MTNANRTVLYIGVTSNLLKRVAQHKNNFYPKSFTAKYRCYKLVWYEPFGLINDAISREKQLKAGDRDTKIMLIEISNPGWIDLYETIC